MAKLKRCIICGREFETTKPNKKYCCFNCKEAGAIVRRMKWEEQNPKYIKNYMVKYRAMQKDIVENNPVKS